MNNKLNGNPETYRTLSIYKEGKRLMIPTPCEETLDPLAMVIKGK